MHRPKEEKKRKGKKKIRAARHDTPQPKHIIFILILTVGIRFWNVNLRFCPNSSPFRPKFERSTPISRLFLHYLSQILSYYSTFLYLGHSHLCRRFTTPPSLCELPTVLQGQVEHFSITQKFVRAASAHTL